MNRSAIWIIFVAATIFIGVKWSPFDYVMEAGAAAYYQARIAYAKGNATEKAKISEAFADRKITLHEYSKIIFPAYLRTFNNRDEMFPAAEQKKSLDKLRLDLRTSIIEGAR